MMCLKTFEKKSRGDFTSMVDWCKFVNDNYRYANEHSTIYDFKGKCIDSDLPSFHPYWANYVKGEDLKSMNKLMGQYDECVKNSFMIKYYFGLVATLDSIQKDIECYRMAGEGYVKWVK